MEQELSFEKGIRHNSWKVRKQTYDRLLYFLKSGDKDVSFGGQLMTLEKVVPLLNSLTEEQNAFVALQGMQCVKFVLSQPSFKISNLNHFLSEGLQKFSVSDKLQTEFEDILNFLMEKWTIFLTGLLISKFENKNPKIIVFCLKILTNNLKKIQKNKEAATSLYKSIQHLYCSQNKTIRLSAVEISTSLEQVVGKKPSRQVRTFNLFEVYNDLLKSFDQMDTNRRINVAGQLRKTLQQIQFTIEPDEDHFTLIYCLRMMIEDSNQLLWSEGVRVLSILVQRGLKIKEIGYLVDKLRVGKHASNQLVFQLFDSIVATSAKRLEQYFSSLIELYDNSNRQNIKIGVLQLILRIAYLVNKLHGDEETCGHIQSKAFMSMPLYQNCLDSTNSNLKNRLVSCYNKQILKWLIIVHASARHKDLTEEIALAMKPFQDRHVVSQRNVPGEKQNKKPSQPDAKAQGLDKVIQEVFINHNSSKELDKKMGKVAQFLVQQSQKYTDPFYFIELVSKLTINLGQTKLLPQCAQKLSGFVVFLLKHFLKTYHQLDNESCEIFLEILLKKLSFSKDESRLRDILSQFAGREKVLSKIFLRLQKIGFKPKESTLKLISKWLTDNGKSFSRYNEYYDILDCISQKMQSLDKQKQRKAVIKENDLKKSSQQSSVYEVPAEVISRPSPNSRVVSLDEQTEQISRAFDDNHGNKIESLQSDKQHEEVVGRQGFHSVEDTLDLDDIRIQQSHHQEAPSYDFENIGTLENGLPVEEIKSRLSSAKNCFFFLKNEVYLKIKNTPLLEQKQQLLRELILIISQAQISDICFQNLINTLFLLFVQVRRQPEIATELQHIYEELRQRKSPRQFMVSLLKSAKPIFQSVSEPQDCEFAATIFAKSLQRLADHVDKSEYLNILCDINDFFQLGQVVYFELYKGQYELVTNVLFKSTKKWLALLDEADTAAILDTFESLFDSSFKRFVEQQLTNH